MNCTLGGEEESGEPVCLLQDNKSAKAEDRKIINNAKSLGSGMSKFRLFFIPFGGLRHMFVLFQGILARSAVAVHSYFRL